METTSLSVKLGNTSYPIHIGENLLSNCDLLLPHLGRKQVAIITNTIVAPLYLEKISQPLRNAGVAVISMILPDGEQYKNAEIISFPVTRTISRDIYNRKPVQF